MTSAVDDPLRAARVAVDHGRFREGWDLLDVQPLPVRRSGEWQLLVAMARWRLGEFAPSHAAALQARDRYRSAGDTDGEMRAENVAAAGAFALGRLAEAERGFGRALTLAERANDLLMMARCANNLGNVALYVGRHDAALASYRLARGRFHRVGMHHGEAEALINIGLVWHELERHEDALEAADAALELAELIQARRLVAQALAMRGEALAMTERTPIGQLLVQRALDMARAEGDQLAQIEALRLLCNIERNAGQLSAARGYGEAALTLARRLVHPWATATVLKDLAAVHQQHGNGRWAVHALTEAAELYAAMGAEQRAAAMRERARQVEQPPSRPRS